MGVFARSFLGRFLLVYLLICGAESGFGGSSTHAGLNTSVFPFQTTSRSEDYVLKKKQYQLHTLLTEQRHPKTRNLSDAIKKDPTRALEMLLSVDEDVSAKMEEIALHPAAVELMANAFYKALHDGSRIYFYGCGATGRLAIQLESSFWRPFWSRLHKKFPEIQDLSDRVIGEATGGDRALVASLPGFEDLQLIGKLQLNAHGIRANDVVVAVTEGGETSSVIGSILTAAGLFESAQSGVGSLSPSLEEEARHHLFFVYNNPDSSLTGLQRSQSVLENSKITKIPLFTGPQAIAGSTRMQATTSELYVIGIALEQALEKYLAEKLMDAQLAELGFGSHRTLSERLRDFRPIQKMVFDHSREISELTLLEAATYQNQRHSYYIAQNGLISVFTDATERAPTFRLFPMDPADTSERKSLIQVWAPVSPASARSAWYELLRRPFRGLDPLIYQAPFETEVSDANLRTEALRSLGLAGNEQQELYDFSFSEQNKNLRGPVAGDLAVFVLLSETLQSYSEQMQFFKSHGAKVAAISVDSNSVDSELSAASGGKKSVELDYRLHLPLPLAADPMGLRQNIAVKMMLNAHSTATMTKLDRVLGNTMIYVNPGNLKLIGRATFLIQSHVNDVVSQGRWKKRWQTLYGAANSLSYADANAALFQSMEYVAKTGQEGKLSEVALSIVRILEPLRNDLKATDSKAAEKSPSWDTAKKILSRQSLESYLKEFGQ